MPTRHTITAFVVKRTRGRMVATCLATVEITYLFSDESADGIGELTLVEAKLIDGDGLDPTPEQVTAWAKEWLDDDGYDAACQRAMEAA